AIAPEVLTRRLLRREARYGHKGERKQNQLAVKVHSFKRDSPYLATANKIAQSIPFSKLKILPFL
ncbi:hypothetical protein, partial [Lacticaseibacillus rhamnosus]|uniref:hypothetical protein n=2 Tax=Lacticaseibacillus rhamnosus TaxID=47715 RepID=UPI000B1E8E39